MVILCIISVDEIILKGIPCERFMMKDLESKSPGPYDSFWKYFSKKWLNNYDPRTWHKILIIFCAEKVLKKLWLIVRTKYRANEGQNRTFRSEFQILL